jgi:hypothetical protein
MDTKTTRTNTLFADGRHTGRWNAGLLAAGVIAASTLIGCGGDTGTSEPEPVDHATTRQAVENNTRSASVNLQHALEYVRQTDLLGEGVTTLDSSSGDCAVDGSFSGDDTGTQTEGSVECGSGEPVEQEIGDGTDELLDMLGNRVFVDANIENESEFEVTYLLDGATVCVAEDFEEPADQQECVADVDQLELRLEVTSPAQGNIDVEVLVGPDRYNPFDLELHQDLLAASTDLTDLRAAVAFASNIAGEDIPDLPTTMRGKLRAEMRHAGTTGTTTTGTISVLQDVQISGDDYDIQVKQASPAAQFTVDSAAQTISGLLDLGTVDVRMPVTDIETTWDAEGMETTTETSYTVDAHLSGASFDAVYAVGEKRIDVQNVGLGSSTSTLDIDQKRVATVDLNRSHGRHLNFSFVGGENGTELVIDPAFDLELMLQFAQVQNKLDGLDEWMLDDMMRITLDGAANPAVLFGDAIEVLEGQLTLSSAAASVTLEASTGQCVLGPEDDAPTPATGSGSTTEPGDAQPPEDTNSTHPFEELRVDACE